MSPRFNKKQTLLDFFKSLGKGPLEVGELHTAQDELRRHLGPGDRTSLGYIASILREAGYEVQYEDRYSDPVMPEPYATRLKGVLEFRDLASAERSLIRLDAVYREYQGAADQAGVKWVVCAREERQAARPEPRRQPARSSPETPGKAGNRALVPGVAGDPRPFCGLAGAAKILGGIPPSFRKECQP